MIIPMKKVSLVLMDKYREDSLEKLHDAGVLHLEQKKVSSEALSGLLDKRVKNEAALSVLKSYKAKAHAKKDLNLQNNTSHHRATDFINSEGVPFSVEALDAPADGKREALYVHILNLEEKWKSLKEETNGLLREQSRIKEWGDFEPLDLLILKENGVDLKLYEFSIKDFASLPAELPYFVIKKTKAFVYAAVLEGEAFGYSSANSKIDGTPFELSKYSLSGIENLLEDIKKKLEDIENKFISLFSRKHILESDLEVLNQEIEFEIANLGLESLEDVPADSTVSWISGFIPCDALGVLKRAAAENGWALAFDDPAPEDMPPTLIKNRPQVEIIKPLFSFLGTIPGYREFDISAPYLIFFSLFFAMIFGDAGYGLLLFSAFVALGIFFKKKSGKLPDAIKLFMLLSFCTIVWGSITGAWFAIPHKNLPFFLRALIIPPFNNTGPLVEFPPLLRNIFKLPETVPVDELKTRWCIQFLCFTIAVIQVTLARATRIIRLLPSLTAVAQAGWLLVMVALYFVALTIMLKIAVPPFVPHLLVVGVSLIVIFTEQKGGNFIINVFKSFSGLFQLFLKLVSCFADILSYIRLFAVGLAGSMMGQVFNSLAVPAEGLGSFGLGFIIKLLLAVVILAFGHGLNLALTAMSVIVHGVRLNLLEYAGNHLEMEWSGYEYNPFASKQKNKQ